MSILSLAMQLQRSHNQSQEDVHVDVDTCCGPKLQLLCPSLPKKKKKTSLSHLKLSCKLYHVFVKSSMSSFCSFTPFFWLVAKKDFGAIWLFFGGEIRIFSELQTLTLKGLRLTIHNQPLINTDGIVDYIFI